MNKYLIIIVQQDIKSNANVSANKVDTGKTSRTFTVPLWAETADVEKDAPSASWCCWWVNPQEMGELMKEFHAQTGTHKGKAKTYILQEEGSPEDILKKARLKVGEKGINAEVVAGRI